MKMPIDNPLEVHLPGGKKKRPGQRELSGTLVQQDGGMGERDEKER